jgi:hypothetical protein
MWFRRGGFHGVGPPDAMAEKKLTQPLSRSVLISFRRLSGSHQVSQRFMRGIGNSHRGKVTCSLTPHQLLSVPAIGLHSISGLHRNEGRGYDVTLYAERGQLPTQHVSCTTRLVAGSQLLGGTELAHQSLHRLLAVGNRPQGSDFPVGFSHSNSNGFRMDIKTDKSYVFHGPAPFACGSAPLVTSTYSVTRAIAKQGVGLFL